MQDESANRGSRQLTAEGLNALLAALHADRDQAAHRYEQLRDRLTFFFARRQFVHAEALADEVLDRIARRLHSGEHIDAMASYAYGVARFVAQEQFRLTLRDEEAHREYARNISSDLNTPDESALQKAIDHCLGLQSAPDRDLLMQYYTFRGRRKIEHRQHIASSLQMTPAVLRKRTFRLRRIIEACVHAQLHGKGRG